MKLRSYFALERSSPGNHLLVNGKISSETVPTIGVSATLFYFLKVFHFFFVWVEILRNVRGRLSGLGVRFCGSDFPGKLTSDRENGTLFNELGVVPTEKFYFFQGKKIGVCECLVFFLWQSCFN